MTARLSRRAFLTLTFAASLAEALGRKPYGGVLRLALPFTLDTLDPHAQGDIASALLAPALTDSLFAWDPSGRAYPTLATAHPASITGGARVSLRPGLVTAHGLPLDARDVVFSLERARLRAGRPLLAPFARPRRVPGEALSVDVPGATPDVLADALASPVTAIVPRSFRADRPDGSGAFRATARPGAWSFERNDRAARGPAFLDRIAITRAPDLSSALRAFESKEIDVGWLGAGLHGVRPGAVPLRSAAIGFIVLRTGTQAGAWGAPGVAAQLASGVAPARLAHLALGPGTGLPTTGSVWGGPPSDLVFDGGSPHLAEIAAVVATALSRPGHELRPAPLPAVDLRRTITSGEYVLAIDFVRSLGPTPLHTALTLQGAANPRLAERPPRVMTAEPLVTTRTLTLGVLGEFAITGAAAAELRELSRWDLGSVWRSP